MNSPNSQILYQKWLLTLAILSFFLTLFLPYIGEEAVYTISSYEMWYNHHYLCPTIYGLTYWRTPLFNWLIICFANLLGWKHMLVASRFIVASATVATSFIVMWLANRVFKIPGFGLFVALVYLTSDALFYHGWLAYSDPLFAFFIVGAISFLWLANLEQRSVFVWLSVFFLIAAFMTKALTAYVFYIISFIFIIHYDGKSKAFLLKAINFLPYLFSIFFYFLWNISSQKITETGMWADIFSKFHAVYWHEYIQQIIFFPLEVFFRFLPASGLMSYYFVKQKFAKMNFNVSAINTLSGLIFFNFIPYWLAPHTSIRYLLPLFPFIALLLAISLWYLSKGQLKIIVFWLGLTILLKYVEIGIFYYYQTYYRGDYTQIARQVLMQTQGYRVYSNDFVATGLSISAEIDKLLYPYPPLLNIQFAKEKNYFVINDKIASKLGKLYKDIKIGKQGTHLYLLCQGIACYSR